MTQIEIIERVRKLLALADSDNVHEAANDAAQAQKLMAKHAIESVMLDIHADETGDEDEPIESDTLIAMDGGRIATWKLNLTRHVTNANGCRYYRFV